MRRRASKLAGVALVTAGAGVSAGCGYIGAPLPPTLDIPARIMDLRAAEYGDTIEVEFTVPALTTEGLALTRVRSVELRAGDKLFPVPATAPGAVSHSVPAGDWIGQDVVVAVRATGPKGKTSDWSNEATLRISPPLPRPLDIKAENVERGVRITWRGATGHYRVFRATGDQKPEPLAESDQRQYLDESTQYGTRYQYWVQAVAGESQQSEISDAAGITPMDEFPPAVPSGLTAAPEAGAIELAWERNTEPDFRAYNVYRSVENGAFENVAPLIQAPAYSDRTVESGKRYRYAVSSVDLTGNESARSSMVEVTAQ